MGFMPKLRMFEVAEVLTFVVRKRDSFGQLNIIPMFGRGSGAIATDFIKQ